MCTYAWMTIKKNRKNKTWYTRAFLVLEAVFISSINHHLLILFGASDGWRSGEGGRRPWKRRRRRKAPELWPFVKLRLCQLRAKHVSSSFLTRTRKKKYVRGWRRKTCWVFFFALLPPFWRRHLKRIDNCLCTRSVLLLRVRTWQNVTNFAICSSKPIWKYSRRPIY